ncbi:hypothetical protein ACOSQ3_002173 [Xanthoceras sorbifolium]
MMIRNSTGLAIAISAICLTGSFCPLLDEALAIRRGLQLAVETGLSPILLESDSLGAINVILRAQSLVLVWGSF